MTAKFFATVGWWLPEHEKHLQDWMIKVNQRIDGRLAYQHDKLRTAVNLCSKYRKRVAIDIGGHCGLWSYYLAREFDKVLAFEPVKVHRECFRANVEAQNVTLLGFALGDKPGKVSIHTSDGSSGDSWVKGDGDIEMVTLDDILPVYPGHENVDFIKADCEGFELYALKGGAVMIERCRPVIVVEQKPGRAQKFGLGEIDAVTWLEGMGYRRAAVKSGDYFMVP